jgi:hypothetical protein
LQSVPVGQVPHLPPQPSPPHDRRSQLGLQVQVLVWGSQTWFALQQAAPQGLAQAWPVSAAPALPVSGEPSGTGLGQAASESSSADAPRELRRRMGFLRVGPRWAH